MPDPIGRTATVSDPSRFSLHRTLSKISLNSMGNGEIPRSAECQTSNTPGIYNRAANAHAMSVAVNLMSEAREGLTGRNRTAMDKTLRLLGPNTSQHFGDNLLIHLTALGAMHEGIQSRLEERPGDASLTACLAELDKAVVEIGIKAGKCPTVADGGYHGEPRSLKLTREMERARQSMIACISDGEGKELLEHIAKRLLVEPLRNSILARQGQENLQAFLDGANPIQAVQKQMADDVEHVLQMLLDTGGAEEFMGAILNLIKLSEYVVQAEAGRRGGPVEPPREDHPPLTPEQLRDLSRDGAPVLSNYAPVHVENNVSELIRALGDQQSLKFSDIRNLLDATHERGVQLGRSQVMNEWMDSIIKDQDRRIESLERRLEEKQDLYDRFFNGNGSARREADPAAQRPGGPNLQFAWPTNDISAPNESSDAIPDPELDDHVSVDRNRRTDASARGPGSGAHDLNVTVQVDVTVNVEEHLLMKDLIDKSGGNKRADSTNRNDSVEKSTQVSGNNHTRISAKLNGNDGPRIDVSRPDSLKDRGLRTIRYAAESRLPAHSIVDELVVNEPVVPQRVQVNVERNQDNRENRLGTGNLFRQQRPAAAVNPTAPGLTLLAEFKNLIKARGVGNVRPHQAMESGAKQGEALQPSVAVIRKRASEMGVNLERNRLRRVEPLVDGPVVTQSNIRALDDLFSASHASVRGRSDSAASIHSNASIGQRTWVMQKPRQNSADSGIGFDAESSEPNKRPQRHPIVRVPVTNIPNFAGEGQSSFQIARRILDAIPQSQGDTPEGVRALDSFLYETWGLPRQ